MSIRHVWKKYVTNTTYIETSTVLNGKPTQPSGTLGIYIAKAYTFDSNTGKYTLSDPVFGGNTTLGPYDAGEYRYMAFSDASVAKIYSTNASPGYGNKWHIVSNSDDGSYFIHSGTGQITEHTSDKSVSQSSSLVGTVSSSSANAYPEDGVSGFYWYVYQGSDSIDPTAVSYSTNSPKSGEDVTISVTPRASTYGGVITYRYEISLDGTSWSLLSTTTGTSVNCTIPKGTQRFAVRVLAGDNYGFTSTDYVTGASLIVTNNAAPSAPGSITVPTYVKGGGTLAISWDVAADEDDNLTGYKLERSYNGGSWTQIYQGADTSYTDKITYGWATVQYRVKAYDADGDESGYTASESRAVTNTVAPSAPASITVPVSPVAEAQITVTWTAATDGDDDLAGYALERQLDDGSWTEIYRGTALYYVDTFDKGFATVTYRVRAYDSEMQYSDYTTSAARTIVNNNAPVITCDLSGDLGTKSEGFAVPYSVSDADADTVTVTEQVDDRVRRTYTATLGEAQTFDITDADGERYWMRLLNGEHTIKITADDGTNSTVLALTFSKAVHSMSVTLETPLEAEEAITVAVLSLLGNIPDDAVVTLECTNNALDAVPVWQDVLADVLAGRNIVFANTVQANGPAFNFRLSVARGESGTGGYLTSVHGGYQ